MSNCRFEEVRKLVKDPSLRVTDIAKQTGYNKGHVSRLRKEAMKNSSDFECPRCGHCCQTLETEPFEYWSVADGWVKIDGTKPVNATHKNKHEWVGLTDEDIHDAFNFTEMVKQLSWDREPEQWCKNFAAYIEAKLRDKNG